MFSLGHPIRTVAKVYLALFGALGVAAYAGLAIYAKTTGWVYPFAPKGTFSPPDFGFFPNRNHTAALLVTGAVLSLGILREAWSGRRPVVFVLAGASMAVCAYALLFQSTSRGGVVFLGVGALVWVAMLGRGHLSTPLVVSASVIAMLVAGIFFATESPARTRVLELLGLYEARSAENVKTAGDEPKAPAAGSALSDFRLKVFRDASRIVRDYPITGTGLGTYGYVSPFYVDASIGEAIPIHPESDWLMAAAESGLPFVLCAAALLFVLIRDNLPMRRNETWPLRWGLAAAALAAILHGFVDVPLHRVEIGWWVLVLAGLAFGNPSPTGTERNPAWWTQR
jgi:O-antigen ligase